MLKTQKQINFIKQVCGGDSLQHVLIALKRTHHAFQAKISAHPKVKRHSIWVYEAGVSGFHWSLESFNGKKHYDLEDQFSDTIETIAKLLGFKEEVEHAE